MITPNIRDGYRLLPWCRGLPFITKIRISPGEIGRLQEVARREVVKAIVIIVGFIALGVVCIPLPLYVSYTFFPGNRGTTDLVIFFGMILLFLIVIPMIMSITGWPLKRALAIQRDLADGHALMFAGRRHELNALKLWKLLSQTRMMADGDVVLVVLPLSGLVASVNWEPPPMTAYVDNEQLPEPVTVDDEQSTLQMTERPVSDPEHSVLLKHGDRMVRDSILQALGAGSALLFAANRLARMSHWFWDAVIFILAVVNVGYWVRRALMFRRAGTIGIVVVPAFPADDKILHDRSGAYKSGDATNRWQHCYFIWESLPGGSVWSVNHVASEWWRIK